MTKGNSTTNAILVIILVLVVGFGVWYVMDKKNVEGPDNNNPSVIEVNLGGEEGETEQSE